jgi:hypothetical protein
VSWFKMNNMPKINFLLISNWLTISKF